MAELDFRTNKDQDYKGWSGEWWHVTYEGKCAVCGRRVYNDGYNDGRGALGFHAAIWLVASEFEKVGDDILLCWECSNNDADRYHRGVEIAMRLWKDK